MKNLTGSVPATASESANAVLTGRKPKGTSRTQAALMMYAQNGKCAICGDPGTVRILDLDHNHKSGRVRAYLCNPCNIALGQAHEDPDRLRKMADYLEQHQFKQLPLL